MNPREWLFGRRVGGNNLSPSREPIDPDLKTDVSAPQLDGPAARHAAREENDRSAGFPTIACVGEQGVEPDVARQLNAIGAGARAYGRGGSRQARSRSPCVAEWLRCDPRSGAPRPRARRLRASHCEVARGMAGRTRLASNAIIARTQTTSISVNPAARLMARLLRCALDRGGVARAAWLAARTIRSDFIGRMVRWRTIEVGSTPGIGRNRPRLEVRPVP